MYIKVILLVSGIVQGIGFRPFCAKLAQEIGVTGSVSNTSEGVFLEIFGTKEQIESYQQKLLTDAPPLSYIQSIQVMEEKAVNSLPESFQILPSTEKVETKALIPPDIATCEDCLAEMTDPSDRRFEYPFINCTNCGPRFTIIESLPYDRPKTTMAKFKMCPDCKKEYEDCNDRRYHAQPVACPHCGPHVWLESTTSDSALAKNKDAIDKAIRLLKENHIVAIKGLGGFHLSCLPSNEALSKLRARKKRPYKALALMVKDITVAEKLVHLTDKARSLLNSPRKPIVVCRKKDNSEISELVAPKLDTLGVMLPYTPLHFLLLREIPILVMTSANVSETPIVSSNDEAKSKLSGIVDYFLMHNRDIRMKIDDSVVASAGKRHIFYRRARGYVPHPILVKKNMPRILAAGAEMKSTFAITIDKYIIPSQYLGDLKSLDTATYYEEALKHFFKLYKFTPTAIVKDLHPQYVSSQIVDKIVKNGTLAEFKVQHHHAHMVSCMVENGINHPVIGLILDGTGLGTDGNIWGGEILVGDLKSFTRKGFFHEAYLPGGEKAILEPWRFAYSLLYETFGKNEAKQLANLIWPNRSKLIPLMEGALRFSLKTSSCGRLFDGVAALIGLEELITYDGQAAMELEAISSGAKEEAPFSIIHTEGNLVLDWRPAIKWITQAKDKLPIPRIAAAFHKGLAKNLANMCYEVASETGIKEVVLSGGVWQNKRLFTLIIPYLKQRGLRPHWHTSLSPNDESISVGQAVIGAALIAE
ncbi:carbamoyltransferase HypF [Thermovirga sp.]|uniref:carbamoyltransferase HypF n=1 Tax=Thermovirga sp. TaxID=2699834 RepID=UPI0025FC3528|nr:carbamoyltransferase HypF [Thermovirga sp.]MBO8153198.1 carbamoyltransferase HypF [Thermovirga sp.]